MTVVGLLVGLIVLGLAIIFLGGLLLGFGIAHMDRPDLSTEMAARDARPLHDARPES